ncbi:MAG: rod shape-determining protein MreD [Alphaproteobacteria bacterium]|nr:rod shape-determining protein MreD [Alphaproteobacteria bacterium]
MAEDFATRVWIRAGLAVPAATTIALVVAAALPVHVLFYANVAPALGLMGVYFWTLRRPDLMPNSVVFAAGLLQDVLLGTHLGVFTLVFLIARTVVDDARPAILGRPYWAFWLGFGMVSAAAMVVAWGLVSILSGHPTAIMSAAFTSLMPFVVFPAAAWVLAKADRLIVAPEGAP